MNNSINVIRVEKILKIAQAEIRPFEHKKSKKELIALCMMDICDGLLHGVFTEEQMRATGSKAFHWLTYVSNMDFRCSTDEDYFLKYAEYLGYKYKSPNDAMPMLTYHADLYFQAAQRVVKLLDKRKLK